MASEGATRKLTIFEELRDTARLPESEKSLQRLTDEGSVLLIAATETPAKVLALVTYHLLANPPFLEQTRTELSGLQSYSLADLQALPFLTACIREGLRLHSAIVARSQRISPSDPLLYHQLTIPAGTPVSCTSIFMHYNSDIFEEPRQFKPDSWLQSEIENKRLGKYLVSSGCPII